MYNPSDDIVEGLSAYPDHCYAVLLPHSPVHWTQAAIRRGSSPLSVLFQLRVRAVDSSNPLLHDEEDVTITIRRNVNGPTFTRQTYTQQLTERATIGSQVIAVTATDADLVSSLFLLVFFFFSIAITLVVPRMRQTVTSYAAPPGIPTAAQFIVYCH